MKNINFVNQDPEERNNKFYTWFIVSSTSFVIVLTFIIILHLKEISTLKTVKQRNTQLSNELAQFQLVEEQKKNLESKQLDLKNKLAIIALLQQKNNIICEQLNALQSLNSKNCRLLSSSMQGKSILMTLECPTIEMAHFSVATVAQNPFFKGLTLQSIEITQHKTLQIICKTPTP